MHKRRWCFIKEFLIEIDGNIFEISEIVKSISFTDKLNDGCSKLEFSYIDDNLKIRNGSAIRFIYDEIKFFGYVFKYDRNSKNEITVTAYDQLRYCKTKDTIVIKNDTITSLTKKMCNYFGFRTGHLTNSIYKLPISVQADKTWLDIIYSSISETLVNKGKWYALRDEFGSIAIRDLEELYLPVLLGDNSLCYDYGYSKSIDDEFYNQVKLIGNSENSGNREIILKDSNSIKRFGLLQYFEILDENTSMVQAKSKAEMLLKLYNHETETLSLNCLGDTRIRSGVSFFGNIEDIGINRRLITNSVTHSFIPVHTMSLEVMI